MGQNMHSSEIEQMAFGWKKAVLYFVFKDDPQNVHTIKGNAAGVLKFFRSFEKNPSYGIISLKKAFELKDVPDKIWRALKRTKYLPMMIRSKRKELFYALKETCHFGPLNKNGDN